MRIKKTISLFAALVLFLSACGNSNAKDPTIATAVAKTVEAQFTQAAAAPTETPAPAPTATQPAVAASPAPTATATNAPAQSCTLSASYVSQTIPDGTIFTPGEQFTQNWQIKNTGTCTWDSSYKLVFWDGDTIGGAYSYNLPGYAAPGETLDIPVVFTAPDADGEYTGYWKIQSPWGTSFGVGQYDQPFYAKIVVSSDKKPGYGITSVSYQIVRDPEAGCQTINTRYTFYATITVNGPLTVKSQFYKSDDTYDNNPTLEFEEAGSKTVSTEWLFRKGVVAKDRYVQLVVTSPKPVTTYDKAVFYFDCK
jgi:hypothetical protein